MATYTVYEPADFSGTITQRADAVTFVKEGFAWLALFFPILWLLYNRMWIVLAGFVGIVTALEVGLDVAGLGEDVAAWAASVLVLIFAFQANDLRRWTLGRRGYRFAWPVSGPSRDACEGRFFETWLAAQGEPRAAAPDLTERKTNPPAVAKTQQRDQGSNNNDDVIGLFPDANA